jgi:hypothetical protein
MTGLTRALLDEVGIESMAVLAKIGEDDYVPENWPSPLLFNHCIVGIPVSGAPDNSGVLRDTQFGDMLIFDPTQRYTPVGELPSTLLGTRILLGRSGVTGLLELPKALPGHNQVHRVITGEIQELGDFNGTIRETTTGGIASYLRRLTDTSSEKELREFAHDWIIRGTRMAEIDTIEVQPAGDLSVFIWEIQFKAPRFAKPLGREMYSFRPFFLMQLEWVPPREEERTTPYLTQAWSVTESMNYSFVDNLTVENVIESKRIENDFGEYTIESEQTDNGIKLTRNYTSYHRQVPAEDYPTVVDHFKNISRLDTSQVVLKLQP